MNRFSKISLALLLLSGLMVTTACGAQAPVLPHADVPFDPTKLGTIEQDVTYSIADGVPLKMDIYYPQVTSGPVSAVVYIHGGFWMGGNKASGDGVPDIPELVARGYLVAAVNYRLAPQHKFPAQIEDIKCAIRFLRANATTYRLDPARIGAWGGSAGGHLVALLGVTDPNVGFDGSGGYPDQSSRVQAVVDMFGPTDLTVILEGDKSPLLEKVFSTLLFGTLVFGTLDRESEVIKRASPVTHVSSDDPPFLILHGEKDQVVPLTQSQALYEKLVSAGVPVTLIVIKNGGHGFTPVGGPITPTRTEITEIIADFFDQYLRYNTRGQ